jgi:hypothetical protein
MAKHLNDRVEDIHRLLVEDKNYLALLGATSNAQAVEGSLFADTAVAAQMIRDKAFSKRLAGQAVFGQERLKCKF